MSEFVRIRAKNENMQIREYIAGTEEKVFQEIVDQDTSMCDLNQFSDLVDLFTYLPNREKDTS